MQIHDFFREMQSKKIALVGMGMSHIKTAKMFKEQNLDIFIFDKRDRKSFEPNLLKEFEVLNIPLFFGEYYEKFVNFDVIFRTPGMNFHDPLLTKARQNGKMITSEMEIFIKYCPCKTIAITGSDGKTTTTTLIYSFLKKSKKNVHIGGNIGSPLLHRIFEMKKEDVCVIELSSFQLISMRYHVDISVITNITENHLDVHKNMEEYVNAKKNVFLFQKSPSITILNYKDDFCKAFISEIKGKLVFTNGDKNVYPCCFLDENGEIVYKDENGKEKNVVNRKDIKLKGEHNVKNFMCAIAAVIDMCDAKDIEKVAKTFNGVEHRMEFVKEKDGVKFYNDSIASTPTRVIAGFDCFDQKIIIISGGYDKNLSFDDFAKAVAKKVKAVVLIGQSSDKIEKALRKEITKESGIKIEKAKDMQEAVKIAKQNAVNGDVIALSPACASFDMYKNFEKRGKHFKEIVSSL